MEKEEKEEEEEKDEEAMELLMIRDRSKERKKNGDLLCFATVSTSSGSIGHCC